MPWPEAAPADEERDALRTELGRQVARLHQVTGTAFGYPSGALGLLAADWRTAFTAMTDAVLADARDHRPWLPRPADEAAALFRAAAPALDAVTVPVLVHFDLWPGNILVDRPAGGPARIGGLIDGERMFWATRSPTSSRRRCSTTSGGTTPSSPVTRRRADPPSSTRRPASASPCTGPTST
ncbi:hypothetical protein SALBM217S_03209 [Streptomyces griseoloalbus]